MARLKISAPDGSREVRLDQRLTIGRVEGDLVLDDKGISRKHCEIVKGEGGFLLRDLGSSNGTLVNGEKVSERRLADGDKIRLGAVTLSFLESDSDAAVRFTAGEHAGRELPLAAARTTLGRRPENGIPFVDVKVSGVHLEIVQEGDSYVLRDLGSTNGTFLDGRKVTEVALSHGDRVKLGDNEFTFVDRRKDAGLAAAAAAPARLAAPAGAKKGKLAAVLGLTGVVVVLGGAAAWYFKFSGAGNAPTSGRAAPPAPSGTLLAEDWSFEDAAATSALWTAELGEGFASRKGRAASGSFSLAASVSGGVCVASRRQPIELAAARALRVTGRLAADEGALVSVGLRFLDAAGEGGEGGEGGASKRAWTLVAARRAGGDFEPFDVELAPPAWAKRVEVVAVARGEGSVAVDDLALETGALPPSRGAGEVALLSRGPGAFFVDHHAPLAELFVPCGSGPVASLEESAPPQKVDLPPGAFDAAVTAAGESSGKLTLDPGKGAFAAEGFAALVAPEVAAAGVTLMTARGSERRFGAFEVDGVKAVLLGGAAERFELALAAPARVTGVARGESLELRVAVAGAPLAVAWRTGFEAERKEASELLAKAQEDWRAGHAGAALARLKEIRDRVPYDEKSFASAEQLDGEIVPKLQAQLAAIDAEAEAAEFLGSLERSRKTLALAEALLSQAEGLEAAKEVGPRVERMRQSVARMETEQREKEARRLLKLARAYQQQKSPAPERKATAEELLAELQRSYGDTVAAREARGEAPANPGSSEGG
jgi:pSer/pThr/pTyr-binding forkhead associated (FHA) protein